LDFSDSCLKAKQHDFWAENRHMKGFALFFRAFFDIPLPVSNTTITFAVLSQAAVW
jgi:hypothetical protein